MKIVRIPFGITWRDRKRASRIRDQTYLEDILNTIKRKKWIWAEKLIRRTDNRRTAKLTEWQTRDGKRRQTQIIRRR